MKNRGRYIWNTHPDYEWYEKKVDGHGGAATHIGSRLYISYIGSTPKYKIMWYNTILYYRWLKRKLVRSLGKLFDI
jgi:hypothetical protein